MPDTRAVVILDTCVLFPASLRDTLLRGALEDLYEVRWSAHTLEELVRNLIGTGETTSQGAERLSKQMREYFPKALIAGYEALIPTLTCHEKDRHVLAAAIVAKAQRIVTINLRDFPAQSVLSHGVVVEHPDTFLTNTSQLHQEALIRIVQQQAADLRHPPLTPGEVLDVLSVHVPNFAHQMQMIIKEDTHGA